jgi:hypothetical protein
MLGWMVEGVMGIEILPVATPTILGTRPSWPVLVCVDGRVVGDAVVVVSEQDPNWWRGMAVRKGGEIRVSRVFVRRA